MNHSSAEAAAPPPGFELLVFVRQPLPGRVKTRLAAELGPRLAADLHRVLVERTLAALAPLPRVLCVSPPEGRGAVARWLPGETLRVQQGGDLGERMALAFAEAFAGGASGVVLVGTDTLDLDAGRVRAALRALARAPVVLGPATDGGYCLIGLGALRPELFTGIDWGTGTVAAATRARAAALGLRVEELPVISDLDTPDDLRAAWSRLEPLLAARGLAGPVARALGLPRP